MPYTKNTKLANLIKTIHDSKSQDKILFAKFEKVPRAIGIFGKKLENPKKHSKQDKNASQKEEKWAYFSPQLTQSFGGVQTQLLVFSITIRHSHVLKISRSFDGLIFVLHNTV